MVMEIRRAMRIVLVLLVLLVPLGYMAGAWNHKGGWRDSVAAYAYGAFLIDGLLLLLLLAYAAVLAIRQRRGNSTS
jgi:hypothetical protein